MSTYNLQHLFLLEFAAYFGNCWNSKSKSLVLLRFHLRDVFLFLLLFSIVDFGTFLVRLMNSYLTFSSLLFQVCVCYVLNHIFTARTLKTLHKYGNTYLNSTEFIAVCMQK